MTDLPGPGDTEACPVCKALKCSCPPDDGWLCHCGHWQEDLMHCDHCKAEPPPGCPCSFCQDGPDEEEADIGQDYYHEDL